MEVNNRNYGEKTKQNNIRNEKPKNSRLYLNLNNQSSHSNRNNSNTQNTSSAGEDSIIGQKTDKKYDNQLYYNKNIKKSNPIISSLQSDRLNRPLQQTLQKAISKAINQSQVQASSSRSSNRRQSPKQQKNKLNDYGFFKQNNKPGNLKNISNSSNNFTLQIQSPTSTQISQQSYLKFPKKQGFSFDKETEGNFHNQYEFQEVRFKRTNSEALQDQNKSRTKSPTVYNKPVQQIIAKNDPKKIKIQLQNKQDLKIQRFSELQIQNIHIEPHCNTQQSDTISHKSSLQQAFLTSRHHSSVLSQTQITDMETQNFMKQNGFVTEKICIRNFIDKLFIEYKDIISDNSISQDMIEDLKQQIHYNLCQREDGRLNNLYYFIEDILDIQKLQMGTKRLGLLGIVLDGLKDFNEQERSRLQGLRTSEVIEMKEEIKIIQGKDVVNIQNILQEFMESLYKGMESEVFQRFNFEMRRMVLKFKETEKLLSIVHQKVTDNFDLFRQESINRKLIRELRDENCLLRENTLILENEIQKLSIQVDLLNTERDKLYKENDKLCDRSDKYCQQILNISQNQINFSNKKSTNESPIIKPNYNLSPQHCNINIFDDENRSPLRTFQTNQNKSPFKLQNKQESSSYLLQIIEYLVKQQQNTQVTVNLIINFASALPEITENAQKDYLNFFNKITLQQFFCKKPNKENSGFNQNQVFQNVDYFDSQLQDEKIKSAIQKCMQISGIDIQIESFKSRKPKKRYGTELIDELVINSNQINQQKTELSASMVIILHSNDLKIIKLALKNILDQFQKNTEDNNEIQEYLLNENSLVQVLFACMIKNNFQETIIQPIFDITRKIIKKELLYKTFTKQISEDYIFNLLIRMLDNFQLSKEIRKQWINIVQLKKALQNVKVDSSFEQDSKDKANLILKNINN